MESEFGGVAEGVLQGKQILLFGGSALQPLRARLVSLGATVDLAHPDNDATDARTIERFIDDLVVGEYDDVVFSTAHGVRLLCEYAEQIGELQGLLAALRGTRLIARGRRTSVALSEVGLDPAIVAGEKDVRALGATSGSTSFSGRVVGVQATTPSDGEIIAERLRGAGARVRLLSQSTEPDGYAEELLERILSGTVDSIAFGSAHQLRWLESEALAQGRRDALYAALSATTLIAVEAAAALLRDRGQSPRVVPARRLSGPWEEHELRRLFSGVRSSGDAIASRSGTRRRVVVIGNGMVGHRLCDRLTELDKDGAFHITVFGEEARIAYDRVHLTSYFESRDADELALAAPDWYARRKITLRTGERVVAIDRRRQLVESSTGDQVAYDYLVFATGSEPFVPPVSGTEKAGVFVYRTIEDLDALIAYSAGARTAVVVGGGLLGLEAAKAVHDLGLETHVVECAARLMPRQLDAQGGILLRRRVEGLGVQVHLEKTLTRVLGESRATGLRFADGSRLEADVVVISAGIRPRDELAREAEISVGARGGIVVDDTLCTNDRRIFAIGECAVHRGLVYGLVGPGYEMAEALASHLTSGQGVFRGADTSTKLKLLGIDVASFGDPFADERDGQSIVFQDLVSGVYKKLLVDDTGELLLGGILVGDARQYAALWNLMHGKKKLPVSPESLLLGTEGGARLELDNEAQICSCNNVSKQVVCEAIQSKGLSTVGEIKSCTRAGTGCGGCIPLLNDILTAELQAAGQVVKQRLCEHFEFTRAELFEIVRIKKIRTFDALLAHYGRGNGCEICKPTVASILASVFNDHIVEHATLQDTNDRFLANLQRGGLYSVVPRVPGGELTPDKLIALGEVAKKFGLYTKITGGQRVDLFGAKLDDLPDIWEKLVEAGFESGHAYGKAMRTVKSCVGSTWCRYGVRDSVGFAIKVEERYKGIRAPHKMKAAVSGCIRECAEAQSKDFGLIATERGWNVYVCGNGGAKPRHADLLVADVDEQTALQMLDRFVMFYIRTADRLTRTSVWLEKMEGGIEHLRDVIVRDSLGLCEQLEGEMQQLVDGYRCEWTEVVRDPAKRARFRHFANAKDDDHRVEFVHERGQKRPADWPFPIAPESANSTSVTEWVFIAQVDDFPADGGMAIRHDDAEIAVYNFSSRGEWYATDNRCPHMNEQVLARGIIGDQDDIPKVACPVHKKTFSLEDGRCLSDAEQCGVRIYPVKLKDGSVFVRLPKASATLISPARLNRAKVSVPAAARR